ncbi:MAG: NHL repeat-containing protein [Anaerolineae bacterium]|nr:NHL repeat-containing protein [Anaerolineae bacterium]
MLRKLVVLFFLLLITVTITQAQDQPSAAIVYGQPDFTSNAAGHTADGLSFPVGLAIDSSGGVYVADRNNSRILYYTADGNTSADRVYGQYGNLNSYIANFDGVGGSGVASADSLDFPVGLSLAPDGGLYVTDRENHRVLYFANDGNTTADRVYGQFGSYATNPPNNDGVGGNGIPSADTIGVFSLGVLAASDGALYVSDSSNHRVLYFANDGNTTADGVYGQFGSFANGAKNNGGTPSADTLNFPRGLALDSTGGLYVADRENHRVLYFANDGNTTADRVYGHNGIFTSGAANDGGAPSADNFNQPPSVALDSKGGLYVADRDNNRVLYFADDGDTTADWVFGQFGSFTSGAANNDGSGNSGAPSAQNLKAPQFVLVAPDGSLYISDTGNNRILVVPASVLP